MRHVVLFTGLLAACQPPSDTIAVPSDISYVAWAVIAANGDVSYTALSPVDDTPVFSVGDDARAVLLGFDERVGEVIDRFDIDVSMAPLSTTDDECGPRISAPTVLHTTNGASLEPPPLTASWVEAVCVDDLFQTEGVNCDACVEPDCRIVEATSTPITVDPVHSIFALRDASWGDGTTLYAVPGIEPLAGIARIRYDTSDPVPAPAIQVDVVADAERVRRVNFSSGSLWLVDGTRIHRATRDAEIEQTFELSFRPVVHGAPDGPTLLHRLGGPAYELTRTGTIAPTDLPDVIHAMTVVAPDEVVVITDTDVVWVRGDDTYRQPLPEPYTSRRDLSDDGLTVAVARETVVITGRDLPVFRHTRGEASWMPTPWPIDMGGVARASTALAGGILVVGNAQTGGALMYLRDERACLIVLPLHPQLNAVVTEPENDVAVAVTNDQGLLRPARLVDIRIP